MPNFPIREGITVLGPDDPNRLLKSRHPKFLKGEFCLSLRINILKLWCKIISKECQTKMGWTIYEEVGEITAD